MEGYGAKTYGERWSDVYDDLFGARLADDGTDLTVERLVELSGDGRVLELAIGTGRVALPLVERGLEVHGIDASQEMLELLQNKPGGEAVATSLGDIEDVDVEGEFDLILLVFNTLFALTTQQAQVRCFQNAAHHLGPDGVFVIEAFVPDLSRFDGGQTVRASRVQTDRIGLEVSKHDAVSQTVESQHVMITEGGTRLRPVYIRYSWPSELDLMARLAGLRLRERWGGWDRSPFTTTSTSHVSIYEPAT